MYYIYILLCCNNHFYVCFTDDLKRRLQQHSGGQVRFTKNLRPVKLVYYEKQLAKDFALKREKQIKGWTRIKKINLIKYGHPTKK